MVLMDTLNFKFSFSETNWMIISGLFFVFLSYRETIRSKMSMQSKTLILEQLNYEGAHTGI